MRSLDVQCSRLTGAGYGRPVSFAVEESERTGKAVGPGGMTRYAAAASTVEFHRMPRVGDAEGATITRGGGHVTLAPSSTQRLRQSRLLAAALFLAATQIVVWLWFLVTGEARWPVHAAAATALAVVVSCLSRRTAIAPARLRALEFAMFGLMVGALSFIQYQRMFEAVARGDAVGLMAESKNFLIGSQIVMLAYTMLIPNSRRTASVVVLVIAIAPVVVEGLLFHRHPEALQFARESRVLMLSGMNLLLASTAAALAIFGTHVLNTLRQEVFEVRRLNQYQLVGPIGTGGMGDVYLAEHRLLKRACAIKLIHPDSERDPLALRRFECEARATARLSHPNIVEVYDYGETDEGTFFYVMEYLDGLNLGELVDRHGPLLPGRVIYLLSQVCDGLAEAHASGLIHRDIKPTNIFAARVGRRFDVAKLLDFGLVKDTSRDLRGGVREDGPVGTPSFMAPEQLSGRPVDRRADLFGLGATAYCLLTGRSPLADAYGFRNLDPAPIVPPSAHRPGLPEDLERVVLRCLEADPADRYPDAESLGEALAICVSAGEWGVREAAAWWSHQLVAPEGSATLTADGGLQASPRWTPCGRRRLTG